MSPLVASDTSLLILAALVRGLVSFWTKGNGYEKILIFLTKVSLAITTEIKYSSYSPVSKNISKASVYASLIWNLLLTYALFAKFKVILEPPKFL